ncbi:MAG: MMPL family transporter, partial [Candidatus Thiodiazotropha sp.]
SISDILTRMNRVINADDPLMEKVPESRDLIAQYLLLYSMSGDPGDFADRIDYDYRRAKLQVMLKTSDQELHKQLYKEFDNYAQAHLKAGEKAEFGGEVMFWSAVVDYIVKGKILNILAAVTIVWLLCSLIYRSAIGGLFSIVPLAVCTLLTFGIMGFAGIRLEMGTAIITSFAVGIGVDFAIHYLSRVREESKKVPNIEQAAITAAGTSGKAIVYDVMSNVLGFSVFVFSGFVPIQYFGWLISLTMITVAIGTLVLLPMMLSLVRPAFITNCNKVDMDNAIPNAAT